MASLSHKQKQTKRSLWQKLFSCEHNSLCFYTWNAASCTLCLALWRRTNLNLLHTSNDVNIYASFVLLLFVWWFGAISRAEASGLISCQAHGSVECASLYLDCNNWRNLANRSWEGRWWSVLRDSHNHLLTDLLRKWSDYDNDCQQDCWQDTQASAITWFRKRLILNGF